MIGASRYDAWETEIFMITAVSADGMTLTLNESLRYDHLGMYLAVPYNSTVFGSIDSEMDPVL